MAMAVCSVGSRLELTLAAFCWTVGMVPRGHLSLSHLQARLEICTLRDTVAAHLTPESR